VGSFKPEWLNVGHEHNYGFLQWKPILRLSKLARFTIKFALSAANSTLMMTVDDHSYIEQLVQRPWQ
jgi:hypothetical protein